MPVRNEIKEVFSNAGHRVLAQTTGNQSEAETRKLIADFSARIDRYDGRYPIPDLLSELEETARQTFKTTVPTDAHLGSTPAKATTATSNDGSLCRPIADHWVDAIAQSAKDAAEEYFQHATDCFSQGDALQATQHLCSAIVCSITAIAAQRGWPHSDKDDDLNAVVGLATGILPAEDDDIYQLLMSASEPGLNLNSAFAAAMGQPHSVKTGFYQEHASAEENAMLFARQAVELFNQLGSAVS